MPDHPLDCPARAALTGPHAQLAQRGGTALRYDPGLIPFACIDPAHPEDLATLAAPGEIAVFLQKARVATLPGFTETLRADAVQLTSRTLPPAPDDPRITPLGPRDAAEMLALAEATRPGPFTLRALELGPFWGIRHEGRLIAMAGTRMAAPGFTEISGVCTDPSARGQGLARRLSAHVAHQITAAGSTPFLHAFASNPAAIALYESLGFAIRAELACAIFEKL
ncbi:GNAT family N-acetyltransferase [Vannielia litorea]|uniref:Predicted acetyltransferase, GNAT family n=1 Tax=Vannielia litorea TaxID=1217970 RepID=A0A1N6ICG1_9RHOB|nr:GNAT family N-acetyltransferase [Vannielia litorea]SIO29706.1 Predicted acetyltransferase, GNAT family [Vannielia litorea]